MGGVPLKKIIILILAAAIVIVPFSSSHGEEQALIDLYKDNDTVLSDLVDKYESLIKDREEKVEFYDNYKINHRSTYNMIISLAAKENGLNQIDFDIQNALYNANAREALLEINFRKTVHSIYSKGKTAEALLLSKTESLEQYNEIINHNQMGYASDIEVLQSKYNYKKAENSYLTSVRSLNSSLRSLEYNIGIAITYDDIYLDLDYENMELQPLEYYINSAMNNSPSIVLVKQSISRYETELKHLTKYYISENLTYYREKKESVELNLALSKLTLKQNEIKLTESIKDQYGNLMIKEEELSGPVEISFEIAEEKYILSKDLYNKKLIDYRELEDSRKEFESAENSILLAQYEHLTQIMELEYNSACFMPEED